MITFSPRAVSKDFLMHLPDRSRRVLSERFGLSPKGQERTLDAIGQDYGITRERVRQIESHGLSSIRESDAYETHAANLLALKQAIDALGAAVAHEHALAELAKSAADRQHLGFLFAVGHHFGTRREDSEFRERVYTDERLMDAVERALGDLYESIDDEHLSPEEEFLEMFAALLRAYEVKNKEPQVLSRWLIISKRIGKNPLGEWGRADSPHVRIRNTRDFAYLTLKRHGSPMHFTEVATGIDKLFRRKTHPATTHNELIKDKRFVLVGRGLYALKEWGYEPGIVRDVIRNILEREGGALTREEIAERVKRERYVKEATIGVNLQHAMFTRLPDDRFALAK